MKLRPVSPDPTPCKICGSDSPLFGVQDFNRAANETGANIRPLIGVAVYYRRCCACGLLFTDAFDDWSDEDFKRHIYNDDYGLVDPDFEEARPNANAEVLRLAFKGWEDQLRVLDFGGGNGQLARQLAAAGFRDPETYDPFNPAYSRRPAGQFNLVTCYETIEHMPDPQKAAEEITSFLSGNSLLVLSTLAQPPEIHSLGMGWWYAAARNGHITLFSYRSLVSLFSGLGFKFYPTSNPAFHLICREIPNFARAAMKDLKPLVV